MPLRQFGGNHKGAQTACTGRIRCNNVILKHTIKIEQHFPGAGAICIILVINATQTLFVDRFCCNADFTITFSNRLQSRILETVRRRSDTIFTCSFCVVVRIPMLLTVSNNCTSIVRQNIRAKHN